MSLKSILVFLKFIIVKQCCGVDYPAAYIIFLPDILGVLSSVSEKMTTDKLF